MGMQPGIPTKPQVWKWELMQCWPREGRRPPNLSLCFVPSLGDPAHMGPPALPLPGEPGGPLAPEGQEFLHPRASRWLLAPKRGSSVSSKEETASVSLNCLRFHPPSCCHPRAPTRACCGAAVCFFSNWDCRDTPEDEKAQSRNRKAAARRSPVEMLHLLHLFLFAGILVSQLK